jgi:ABC-type uncharacterized transport system auxiliary subunit
MSARGSVTRNAARVAFVVAMAALGSACALTSRGEVLDVRTFTPEGVHATATTAVPAGPLLRLGRVTSGPHLDRRIVYGDGAYEVSYYEDRRWTERPSLYLRRALDRTVFEERGFRRDLGGAAPALDAELLVFEEVRTPAEHAARIVVRIDLSTDHVLFEDTVAVVEPIVGTRFEDVVAAMARALDATSDEIARRIGPAMAGSISAAQ